MPELPEVETVCRGLAKAMTGEVIARVDVAREKLRTPVPKSLPAIAGARVEEISRRAKYILLRMNNGETVIFHLGMSGRMTIVKKGETHAPEKHDHITLHLKNGARIVFNDARRFGLVDVEKTERLDAHKLFAHLGPEPLDRGFTGAYLAQKLKGKKVAVKLAIMDQRLVVGVGNIYASEALFMAGIDPERAAGKIKPAEAEKLASCIRAVLKKAIAAGGSSLRDYVQADGELGYFQHQWAVYGKAGEKCPGCDCDIRKTGGIKRLVQGARSTFYCPKKQK